MPYESFRRVNEERAREGEPLFANPRNAAAGGLRQLDPTITRRRRLRLFAFAVEPVDGRLAARTHAELLEALKAWGFQVEEHGQRYGSLADVQQAIERYEQLIPQLTFQADGVVIKVDRLDLHTELGTVGGREPRWAIARKFAPEVAVTRLEDIRINVGRTGALNPWAVLAPVEIKGVTVTAATLHNEDLIAQKDIRVGDQVEVIRAGEVIPQVLRPVLEGVDPSTRGKPFQMPDRCPACGTAVEHPADEAMAIAFTKTGQPEEAIRHYKRALELDENLGGAHYGVAFLLLKRGDASQAAEHLRAFLARPPKGPDAERWVRHAESALRDIAGSPAPETL